MIKKIQNAICTSFFVLTPRITFLRTKIWTFEISSTAKMSKFEKLVRKGPLVIWPILGLLHVHASRRVLYLIKTRQIFLFFKLKFIKLVWKGNSFIMIVCNQFFKKQSDRPWGAYMDPYMEEYFLLKLEHILRFALRITRWG